MTEQAQTPDASVNGAEAHEPTFTPEQFKALQDELDRVRKHSDTLLAEKKAETEKRKAEQAEKDRLAEETARKKGDFEALEKQYKDRVAALEGELNGIRQERERDMVVSTALKLAGGLSDNANNQEILQLLIERRLVVENGEVKVLTEQGQPSIATLDDLKKEIASSGRYDALITATRASGSGAGAQTGKKEPKDYSDAERLELLNTNPTLFNQLFMS